MYQEVLCKIALYVEYTTYLSQCIFRLSLVSYVVKLYLNKKWFAEKLRSKRKKKKKKKGGRVGMSNVIDLGVDPGVGLNVFQKVWVTDIQTYRKSDSQKSSAQKEKKKKKLTTWTRAR